MDNEDQATAGCEPVMDASTSDSADCIPTVGSSSVACDRLSEDGQNESSENCSSETQNLSKRQQRRLRKREIWERHRAERRQREKESRKRKIVEAKASDWVDLGTPLPPNRKMLKASGGMADSSCHQRIAIDMAYDELMTDKDRNQCVHQLAFVYAANRRLKQPTQLYFCNFDGYTRKIFDSVAGRENWDVHKTDANIDSAFPKEDIVYLSSDSENVLQQLDEQKVYVIGGLVDHNSHKGVCHLRAVSQGWSHARLPIDEFVHLSSRKVLTVNQVAEILFGVTQHGDWKRAFFGVIPKRKGMKSNANAQKTRGQETREEKQIDTAKSETAADDS